jgi:EmrB/QacA subfamily drug resistance transporter
MQNKLAWTFGITTAALFMTALDNLVVVTALPRIQKDLGASLSSLEWTVNAYTLTFAVLLLTGAALGDRFGRKRMFLLGLAVFTAGSTVAALSSSVDLLVAARAIQGLGGAVVTPLTLTILAAEVPPERRGAILGAWGGIAGLAVAIGPVIGGAIVSGIAWEWIFWINVPIGVVAIPLAWQHLRETRGPFGKLDIEGLVLAVGGLFCLVWGVVRSNTLGWGSGEVIGFLVAGALLVGAFCWWETRSATPMLPMRFFRSRAFAATNAVSVAMYFGMFGSIFLLTQYLQNVLGYSPVAAGVRMLAWTGMTMLVAPVAGALSDRFGGRPFMAGGLALQAVALGWMAAIAKAPPLPFSHLVAPFVIAGIGMGLFFAPVANVVLSSVRPEEEGQASGANNAMREIGGVFGIAVLAAIFANQGGYGLPQHFVDGLKPAAWTGAGIVAAGALIALLIPRGGRERAAAAEEVRPFGGMGSCVPVEGQHTPGEEAAPSTQPAAT